LYLDYVDSESQVIHLLPTDPSKDRPVKAGFSLNAHLNADTNIWQLDGITRTPQTLPFILYYCLSLYFKNGGGSCYIVSVGNYADSLARQRFLDGLNALRAEDEPTLLLFPDAVNLVAADYYEICTAALQQCNDLGDRFAILDVLAGDNNASDFRSNGPGSYLKYAAAYHPYLQTSLNYRYQENSVSITQTVAPDSNTPAPVVWEKSFADNGLSVSYSRSGAGATPQVKIIAGTAATALDFTVEQQPQPQLTIRNAAGKTGSNVAAAWTSWMNANDGRGFAVSEKGDGQAVIDHTSNAFVDLQAPAATPAATATSVTLSAIEGQQTALYNQVKAALNNQRVILPPAAAIAGIYARVDRERGVWKAPANEAIAGIIGPLVKITNEMQQNLNINVNAGKSINAIRSFTGKGTLVWGARTLAGNDNEWRYVSVRRLFNMIEESTQKATAFAVFEANDATTWLKVKAMIESYLYGLWERGALAGATPEAAYFVHIGLGLTMTPQDILEGRMNVEIGVAAVRPAEFIILKFTHKMQEA
jgi:phage tail sheath protein FI